MSQSKLYELDCTRKCSSRNHGNVLIAAITKRSVSDEALASFFKCTCANFSRSIDSDGRYLIHFLASRGRKKLIEWILKMHKTTNILGSPYIDVKDPESGYTALHRSIFYGQIHVAVSLLQHGANQSIMDNEDLTPIDHALLDRPPRMDLSSNSPCEVYAWGTNANYTCGTGSQHQRNIPDLVTTFTKQNLFVKQVCLSKFHSMYVTSNGEIWACGHGEGGRLGVAKGGTCVLPVRVTLSEPCAEVAIGRDHSLMLMNSGNILSCGLNEFHQLGHVPPPLYSLAPRQIKLKLPSAKGVRAGRFHSVAFSDQAVYTWGLNGGHLGHDNDNESTIITPTKIVKFGFIYPDDSKIDNVVVSDGATVITNNRGSIYLLSKYQCKKIVTRFHNIKTVEVSGGEVIGGDKLTDFQKQISILILTTDGQILIWQDSTHQLIRCLFSINRPIVPVKTSFIKEAVFIVTNRGEAFQGNIIPAKLKTGTGKEGNGKEKNSKNDDRLLISKMDSFNKFIDKDCCFMIKLKRIPNIHRAVDISSDGKGNNFAVLQVTPMHGLFSLPQVTSSQMVDDMKALLEEASECDLLHDIIVKVENESFPAHKFILCSGSGHFAKLCQMPDESDGVEKEFNSGKLHITLENIRPIIFKQMMQYLYTGNCDLTTPGPCPIEIKRDPNSIYDNKFVNDITNENIEDQNAEEISAYEAYKKADKKKKQNAKEKKNNKENKGNNDLLDPVRLLQEASKKLSVTNLYKTLSQYYYENGCVVIKSSDTKFKNPTLKFERQNFTDVWDTKIRCSDGSIITAHRCILAARLEYFNGMFAHSWSESSSNAKVSLPIHRSLLEPIIDFLYTDECQKLQKSDDLEFLTSMLVVSDQLFITRLREMCEVTFSSLLNLKNIHEILQLSSIYNCSQLKTCCMEYISLNLSSILENRTLETVDGDILEQLTAYYYENNPIMCTRLITPYMNAAEDEVVLSCVENYPVDFEEEWEEDVPDDKKDSSSNSKKKKSRKSSQSDNDKTRKRNESVSSLDISFDKTEAPPEQKQSDVKQSNDWVKVIGSQQKTVLARLKAIASVKENEKLLEIKNETFVKLVKKDTNDNTPSPIQSPSNVWLGSSPSFSGQIIEESELTTAHDKGSPTQLNIKVVNTKLSQKQRKKLALENKEVLSLADHLDKLNMKKNPWGESSGLGSANEDAVANIKSPWKKIESPIQNTRPSMDKINFSEILQDEKKQKENFAKMTAKPLALTQIEDKAIDDLTKYYTTRFGEEERITVTRVPCHQIAAPQWINKSMKSFI